MSAEMDQLVAEFEKFQSKIARAERQFGNVGQMQEQLAEIEVTKTSPDRTVRVVAGPGGSVKDIHLSNEAMRQQPSTLAASIMATLQQAVAEAARKQAAIVEQAMGGAFGAGGITEQVIQAQAEAFGTTAEELKEQSGEEFAAPPTAPPQPAPPAAPSRGTPPHHGADTYDDDEYGHGSVFEDNDR